MAGVPVSRLKYVLPSELALSKSDWRNRELQSYLLLRVVNRGVIMTPETDPRFSALI